MHVATPTQIVCRAAPIRHEYTRLVGAITFLHPGQRDHIDLALCCSGAVQAKRWIDLGNGEGYIYSAFGRHSLLVDSVRSGSSPGVGAPGTNHTICAHAFRLIPRLGP